WATRAFALVNILTAILFGILAMRRQLPVSKLTSSIIMHIFLLLYLFSFVLVYLNNSPEQTTIRTKLMLSSLTTILVILATVGLIVLPFYNNAFYAAQYSEAMVARNFLASHGENFSATINRAELTHNIQAIVVRPLVLSEGQQPYTMLYDRDNRFNI